MSRNRSAAPSGVVIGDLAAGIATEWTAAKAALIIEPLPKRQKQKVELSVGNTAHTAGCLKRSWPMCGTGSLTFGNIFRQRVNGRIV